MSTPAERLEQATTRKLNAEAEELEQRAKHWWIDYLARPILTALIAAVVGAAAMFSFVLSSAKDMAELNEKVRSGLKEDRDRLEKEQAFAKAENTRLKALSDELRAKGASLSAEKTVMQQERDDSNQQLFATRTQLREVAAKACDPKTKAEAEASADRVTPLNPPATAPADNWFAVVESDYDLQIAKRDAADFKKRWPEATFRIFNAQDGTGHRVYAITVNGRGSKDAATKAVAEVKRRNLVKDAFTWTSPYWTEVAS